MKRHLPRVAAGLCAVVLAGGAGLAVSQARSDSALPAGNASGQGGPGFGGGRGGPGGAMDLAALAEELGVSSAKLETAMESARPDGATGAGGRDGMAAALAKALGLSEAKVTAALEAVRPDGAPRGGAGGGMPPDGATPDDTTPDGATPDDGTAATPGATTS